MRAIMCLVLIILSGTVPKIYASSDIFKTPSSEVFLKTAYTTEQGLPQNTANALVQTRDGYIWIATYGGLARFDGLSFTVFTNGSDPGFINNRILALFEDRHGVLWIGSEDGDVMTYSSGLFSVVRKNVGEPVDGPINEIYVDDDDIVWIATERGLRTYDIAQKVFTDIDLEYLIKDKSSLSANKLRILDLVKDGRGDLWFATSHGLIRRNNDGSFSHFSRDHGVPRNVIWDIAPDPAGGVWLSDEGIIGKFDHDSYIIPPQAKESVFNFPIKKENGVPALFIIGDTLAFVENGLRTYDLSAITRTTYRSSLVDTEGNLWVGTQYELVKLQKRSISIFSHRMNDVWQPTTAVIQDGAGVVWVSSGSILLRSKNGEFEVVDIKNDSSHIISLATDSEGRLWVGTQDKVFLYKDNEFVEFYNEAFQNRRDFVLFFGKDNDFWAGSKNEGLVHISGSTAKSYSTSDGLVNNAVVRILEDRRGIVWIGTKGGLSRFADGEFTNYTTENGLTNNYVRDIYEDQDGTHWIGTYGGGLIRFRDGVFSPIKTEDGLSENIVSRILVDKEDNFWILGNKGVYSVSRSSLNQLADGVVPRVYCKLFGKPDGMQTTEGNGINQPAGLTASDGKLWFPMIQGGVIIDPPYAKLPTPPVYIEKTYLDEKLLDPGPLVKIAPGQQNLEIHYTGITFTRPEQLQFRYQLEGFENEWHEVGTRRIAYYPFLPPGKYTFKVMTAGSDATPENIASFDIEVASPFWKTNSFYALMILGLVGVIVLIYQRRLRRARISGLKQQEFSRALINAHESERQRIAIELHDSLGHDLLMIKNEALFALTKIAEPRELEARLKVIADNSSDAIEDTRAISRNLHPPHLQRFGLTSTLLNMVEKSDESSPIDFTATIGKVDNIFSAEAELSIFRIVQESLNNIIKHSNAKSANVQITVSKNLVNISIEDDGEGFDPQHYLDGKRGDSPFGLHNIVQRAKILGGKYSIVSSPGKGTKIIVTLTINSDENRNEN